MKKYFAELVGTFILVFFGCGTAVVAGDKVGILGISIAFGFALIGAAYGIGPISGCHINPAVSLGVWAAGRMKTREMIGYWIGRDFWGRGIATAALAAFIAQVKERPLHAFVATHNVGSIRVLEKCEFKPSPEHDPSITGKDGIHEVLYVLSPLTHLTNR